jgi:DNA-binding transcriptional MerR regulator
MPTTTRQLSKIANVAEQTVRNYTREYSTLLSPAARGEDGPRVFSDEDVQVFCSIASLRREGVPPAEVIARLQRGDVYIEATPNSPQATPSHTEGPQAALVALSNVQTRLSALERHQATLLKAAALWGALLGGIAALAAGGFVLWLMFLFGG